MKNSAKAKSLSKAAAMVEGVAASVKVEAPKVAKAPAKAAAKKAPAPAPVAEKVLSAREVLILKAISVSEFADPESKAVPNVALAVEVEKDVPAKSLPGLIASLNKKGMIVSRRIKGMGVVALSAVGIKAAAAL